jgi:hypothetical protein
MKPEELKEKAKKLGVKISAKMKKVDIIRAIQSNEGNITCYQTGVLSKCEQFNCSWREDCV